MDRSGVLEAVAFTGLVDLASQRVGGRALLASDEFFAGKENLLKPGRGIFLPDEYTDRGKWMDGWETRRKRVPGHDWCIIKLGMPGVIRGVDIDTNHFLGNHPPYASMEALCLDEDQESEDQILSGRWIEILPKVPLKQGAQNIFSVADNHRWTHVRLNIYPDGGVARLKVYGRVLRAWDSCGDESVDLAAIDNGGLVVAASDMFFGNKNNMIMPGQAPNMSEGWETRRRRDPGHDWAIVQLGYPGVIQKIEIDTSHYKGNYPDSCWVEGTYSPGLAIDALNHLQFEWEMVLERCRLQGDFCHRFTSEIKHRGPWSHVRLNIQPDGGVSRLRVWCVLQR